MSESKIYYRLKKNEGNFFDPTQSVEENKSLANGQVKELELTGRVNKFLLAGGLVTATEAEYKASKKLEAEQAKKAPKKSDDKEIKALKAEAKAKDEANDLLKAEIAELKAATK